MRLGMQIGSAALNGAYLGAVAVDAIYLGSDELWRAFVKPSFSNNSYAIFGDTKQGRIELYASGTLTLHKGVYDVCVVGGGGGGNNAGPYTWSSHGYGGNGGVVTNRMALSVTEDTSCAAVIGEGGVSGYYIASGAQTRLPTPGGESRLTVDSDVIAASGGSVLRGDIGAMGGFGYSSDRQATNGDDGQFAFGDIRFRRYGCGGGGAGVTLGGGAGSTEGGSASGSSDLYGVEATHNSGGGGGGHATHSFTASMAGSSRGNGGSGIIIVRWGY